MKGCAGVKPWNLGTLDPSKFESLTFLSVWTKEARADKRRFSRRGKLSAWWVTFPLGAKQTHTRLLVERSRVRLRAITFSVFYIMLLQ